MIYSKLILTLATLAATINALPGAVPGTPPGFSLNRNIFNKRQDREIPPIPDTPAGVSPGAFHGSRFEFFDEIYRKYGFVDDGRNPAVVHTPVWLFGRVDAGQSPCYPESAVTPDGKPNPGTDVPISINPGEDCTDPGPYHGDYSLGNPFPIYVGASWCGTEWRLNFDVYYVHDGNLMAGHKHDWEGISIIFTKDPGGNDADWWVPSAAIYNRHESHDRYDWKDLITVDVDVPGTSDYKDETIGQNKHRPKIFVGLYSHASFRKKCDVGCGGLVNSGAASSNHEYRSSDWWRLPRAGEIKLWTETKDWKYEAATSTPYENHNGQCGWSLTPGGLSNGF